MQNLAFAFIPVAAVLVGALIAVWRKPGTGLESALQHLAAGVVFGAAAAEILPQVKHDASIWTTLVGGVLGVATMVGLKSLEGRWKGPVGMVTAMGIDILVDGLGSWAGIPCRRQGRAFDDHCPDARSLVPLSDADDQTGRIAGIAGWKWLRPRSR